MGGRRTANNKPPQSSRSTRLLRRPFSPTSPLRNHSDNNGGGATDDDDDGGSAKNDDRRNRRRILRLSLRLATVALLVLTVMFVAALRTVRRNSTAGVDGWRTKRGAAVLREAASSLRRRDRRRQDEMEAEGKPSPASGQGGRVLTNEAAGASDAGGSGSEGGDGKGGVKWADPRHLPPLPRADRTEEKAKSSSFVEAPRRPESTGRRQRALGQLNFRAPPSKGAVMEWEIKADALEREGGGSLAGPKVDYTLESLYTYQHDPALMSHPTVDGSYPEMSTLGDLQRNWPQDNLDDPPLPLVERLVRFDYTDPQQLEAATRFRDAELPFKVYNVPEVMEASNKWTDEYVSKQFDRKGTAGDRFSLLRGTEGHVPPSSGYCSEADDNFFAFFKAPLWDVHSMGPPPTLIKDWTYERWSKHARYVDAVGSSPAHGRHYYWQSGVPPEERLVSKGDWTFVSRDLPGFSSPDPTFFGFDPERQKGIQCRFGERGVTAATHYDAGRNMVAMVTGAKRYILSPPKACSKLGIVIDSHHASFRHSMLNFGHLRYLDKDEPEGKKMPPEERDWLEIARDTPAVETVLRAGEVLYIPSHWFHYITSLQKSAQCNTRSGRENDGTPEFGGYRDVVKCVGDSA